LGYLIDSEEMISLNLAWIFQVKLSCLKGVLLIRSGKQQSFGRSRINIPCKT